MLTDGNATAAQPGGGLKEIDAQVLYKIAEDGQKTLPKKAHLHMIYYFTGRKKAKSAPCCRAWPRATAGNSAPSQAKNRGEGGAEEEVEEKALNYAKAHARSPRPCHPEQREGPLTISGQAARQKPERVRDPSLRSG